jgi:hypothetical protein
MKSRGQKRPWLDTRDDTVEVASRPNHAILPYKQRETHGSPFLRAYLDNNEMAFKRQRAAEIRSRSD